MLPLEMSAVCYNNKWPISGELGEMFLQNKQAYKKLNLLVHSIA